MQSRGDWLGDADRVAELGRRLRDVPVPVDRLVLFRRTLHPEILGRAAAWAPGRPVEIFDRDHGLDLSVCFPGSPLDVAMRENRVVRLRQDELVRAPWKWGDLFRGFDLVELAVTPLSDLAAMVMGTASRQGFLDWEITQMEKHARVSRGNRR